MSANIPFSGNYYKSCMVPLCSSTTSKTPNKIFIAVPRNKRRKLWYEAAGREGQEFSTQSRCYCCEDHFDLPNDAKNWMAHSMTKCLLYMKQDVVPHIFDCQPDRKRPAISTQVTEELAKRQRQEIIEQLLSSDAASTATASTSAAKSESDDWVYCSDKSVQVNMNKYNQDTAEYSTSLFPHNKVNNVEAATRVTSNMADGRSSSCIESQSTNLPGQSFTINDSSSYSPQEIRTINMIVSNLHSYCSRFRNATTKTTADQYKIYLTALESDPVFNAMENNTIDHLDGESDFIKKWMELAEKLNSVNGPKRTWAHWKQKFAEWKFSTRSKYLEMIKGLSIIEAKALYLWGSPEGSNLLLVNSEVSDLKETPEESASTPADDETSFHCFLSAKNLETGRTLNISCERLSNSPILNSDLLDNNYLKIEPIEMDCEDYTELNIKSEDNNYTELNIKTEDNATIDDDDSEMNSLVDVKTENLSDSDMEDVTDADGNISPESTPYLLNSTPSCSNSESLKSEKKWQTKKDALKSTSKKSTIKKMKTKKGKVFYVQIEKIS